MKQLKKLIAGLLAAVVLISTFIPAVFAQGTVPQTISQCGSNFGTDFKIEFKGDNEQWLTSITEVKVGDAVYQKAAGFFEVWKSNHYFANVTDGQYLLIGEGGIGDEGKAQCVIKSEGYDDLTMELDKTNYTAQIVENGTPEGGGNSETEGGGENKPEQPEGTQKPTPAVHVNGSDPTLIGLVVEEASYVKGVDSVSVNGEAWNETEYKMALTGKRFYKDKENDTIFLDKMSGAVKNNDVILIHHADYEDIELKITIVGNQVTVKPADQVDPEDELTLQVRIVGKFEAALENQKGYDAMSSASTNVTQNKNSDVSVEVALVKQGQEPQEEDWKFLHESNILVDPKATSVNLDSASGSSNRCTGFHPVGSDR